MVAAGVRLHANEGEIVLPDEERILLVGGPKQERLRTTIDVAVYGGLWLAPGESQYVPSSLGKHDPKTLDVWAGRGDRWVTLIVFSSQKGPLAARIVNISKHTLEVLPHTRVATLTETDRLPVGTNFNAASTRKHESWGGNVPPVVERPTYPRPTGILRRADPGPGSRSVAMAATNSSRTPSVQDEDVSGVTTATYDYSEFPGGASNSEVDAEQELARVFPATNDGPGPSALAQTFMMVATAGDTLDADPAVYFHQGSDFVLLDKLKNQLAYLPG
ncbi:hypothetical protein PHYPSEUDO_013918 [Phytophthora pseudosyringae]|uniref:Uncharacterized protein n=1 Tax=Phytophthora pseudosyringae TaxID=221518 RepID=A0A8T1V4S2_9STRA|nr:hypothetical protein PHYPSEUDO_013918 [Phytophthora pseudosyringae]